MHEAIGNHSRAGSTFSQADKLLRVNTMPRHGERDDRPVTPGSDSKRTAEGSELCPNTKGAAIGVGSRAIVAALIYAKRK